MMRSVLRLAAVVIVVAVGTACSKKQPPAIPQPAETPARPAPTSTSTQPTAPPSSPANNRDEEMRRMLAILEQVVHFDYDESTIRADAQQLLAAKVPILRSNSAIRIRIEGHADERGSVEYNLALGMRRANAVRDYLAGFGIDASRFETVSFGEDRPAAMGTAESAWSQNRRAEFRVSGMNR